jgi:CheY-like chemotaxis protein
MKSQITVLIAEDDADDRLLFKEAFEDNGFSEEQLFFVHDGVELMEYLNAKGKFKEYDLSRPNLLIMDLNMPRKSGQEAIKEIKMNRNLASMPIVVLTTSSDNKLTSDAYANGVNSFIVKPDTYHELVLIIKNISDSWLKLKLN